MGSQPTMCKVQLSDIDRRAIYEILGRRANDVASFKESHKDAPGSVEMALSREIDRLRNLQDIMGLPQEPEDDES
jgi:hypothetical protein